MQRPDTDGPRGGAPQPADDGAAARRLAGDGVAYTWAEFLEHYGPDRAQAKWDRAHVSEAAGEPQPATEINDGIPHQEPTQPIQNDSDASQLAVIPSDQAHPRECVPTIQELDRKRWRARHYKNIGLVHVEL